MPADKVFISYATDTKPAAEELTLVLEENGIHAWADSKDLHAGQRWQKEIERAASNARQFLGLVGRSAKLLHALVGRRVAHGPRQGVVRMIGRAQYPFYLELARRLRF